MSLSDQQRATLRKTDAEIALDRAADRMLLSAELEVLRENLPQCMKWLGDGTCGGDFKRVGETYRCECCHRGCSIEEGDKLDRMLRRIAEIEAADASDAAVVDRVMRDGVRGVLSGVCAAMRQMDPDVEGKGVPLALLGPGGDYTRKVNGVGDLLGIGIDLKPTNRA